MNNITSSFSRRPSRSCLEALALLLLALAIAASIAPTAIAAGTQNWLRFRGPNGSGVSDGARDLPVESGKLAVLQAGQDWRVLAVNDLAENCYASPAIVAGVIIVRSERHLCAFQNRDPQ